MKRMEKRLAKYDRKIVGWDGVLEGGVSPDATVMSWRGTSGGMSAALQKHDGIVAPGSGGLYLDHDQGDDRMEPGTRPMAPADRARTYEDEPGPDTIKSLGLEKHILGVQCNNW